MKKILPFLLAGLLLACVYISKPLPAPSAEAEIPVVAPIVAKAIVPTLKILSSVFFIFFFIAHLTITSRRE